MERADKITDENGRVKDGYEARANYIAGELSSALGMEIALTDGVISNYQQLTGSIHDLIAAKKSTGGYGFDGKRICTGNPRAG